MVVCIQPNCLTFNLDNATSCLKCCKKLILAERYLPVQKIGQGGFGMTFKAIDKHRWDTPCVVKQFLPAGAIQKSLELFAQESKLLQKLGTHPQIPELYAFFEQEEKLYLIQEFVDGQNLLKELQEKGRYTEEEIRDFLLDMLSIIEYVHDQKVYHRDIKPENIIRRKDGVLFLIDFGISKQTTTTIVTQVDTIAYTPAYAAPEQTRGIVNPTSDLYSLAVTAIRMLTGCIPEDKNSSLFDPLFDALNNEWVWKEWVSQNGIFISTKMVNILDKMLRDRVSERYQSAREVIEVLKNFQSLDSLTESINPKPTLISSPTQRVQGNHTITRALFLKYLGWGGFGVISKFILGSLFESKKTTSFDIVQVESYGNIINRETKSANYITLDLGSAVTMDLVKIPGGTFIMGASVNEKDSDDSERPEHKVTIQPFYISKYQVNQAQWQAIMGNNPSNFKGDNRPVEQVSWYDCQEFCQKLSAKINQKVCLPSEAQWEYACRAGTTTPFYFGETITTELANYNGNYTYANEPKGINRQQTTPVGSFRPNANAFGLYDMHGNVWEWCEDKWHDNYNLAPNDGRAWVSGDSNNRIVRGGSWFNDPEDCRSSDRESSLAHNSLNIIGFRVVLCVR
jgi:formylglycine-generating enzyme required for sulfatase activity